jgi:hypothetical protein
MSRHFIRLEGEIPILDDDVEDIDYEYAGVDKDNLEKGEYEEVLCYAACRIIGHTGLEIYDHEFLGTR